MLAGFLTRHRLGRPHVTLKLAMSIDGKIALPSGESRWITGAEARADVHIHRAFADMVLVGRGTYEADDPALNVRAEGLEELPTQPDVPLGLGSKPEITCGRLDPGDRLVLFTDGLVEARLEDRRFVPVGDVLGCLAGSDFDGALDGVLGRLAALVGDDLGDDLALVLAEFDPGPG